MKWWIIWCLVPFVSHDLFYQNCVSEATLCQSYCGVNDSQITLGDVECCMNQTQKTLMSGCDDDDEIQAVEFLEDNLERTEVNTSTSICLTNFMAFLHMPSGTFEGLDLYASENQVQTNTDLPDSSVSVHLPKELQAGPMNKIVLCLIKWPETKLRPFRCSHDVYEQKLIGLSVQGKNISGLRERVNITMKLTKDINETYKPSCQFFNFTTRHYGADGCNTLWTRGQKHLTCSCDHLTYFAVLVVPVSTSPKDQEILSYISLIGCSLSLFALLLTVLLFTTNRKLRGDVSMKVHINLAIALILLNLHFLPSQAVAATSSSGLCLYVALLLHYSLLATFSWMALEGFHLYLLLVKVFNIYIRRYLLKLSVVGWGVPAVIVSVVVIIDKDFYGRTPLDTSKSNHSAICYIKNDSVKMITTVGPFSLVFLFNVIMFGVMLKHVLILRHRREFGKSLCDRAKKDICTMLGVLTLLGITWGLVFLSFGSLTTASLYLFCILNSLQGFFIFLWFVMSLSKAKNTATKTSSETRSTST